jgi:hypothetical protein
MDKISRVGPPEATGVSDGFYSFVVRLSEPPAAHWIYVFKTITKPTKGDIDPDHVVFDAQQGLLFASEEHLVPEWMRHIDLWILEANAQVEADDAAEAKRRAEAQARDKRDALLKQINYKFKDL